MPDACFVGTHSYVAAVIQLIWPYMEMCVYLSVLAHCRRNKQSQRKCFCVTTHVYLPLWASLSLTSAVMMSVEMMSVSAAPLTPV